MALEPPGQGETATFIPSYITSHPDKVHPALWQHTNSPDVHKLPSLYLHICSPAQWQSFGTKVKTSLGHRSETTQSASGYLRLFSHQALLLSRWWCVQSRFEKYQNTRGRNQLRRLFAASLHSSRAHPCTNEPFFFPCYACCSTLEAPTSTIWMSFQHLPCIAMFWFTSEGSWFMHARPRLLPHLIHNGSKTTFTSGLGRRWWKKTNCLHVMQQLVINPEQNHGIPVHLEECMLRNKDSHPSLISWSKWQKNPQTCCLPRNTE